VAAKANNDESVPVTPSQEEHGRINAELDNHQPAAEQPTVTETTPAADAPPKASTERRARTPMLFTAASILIGSILLLGAVYLLGNQSGTGYVTLGMPRKQISSTIGPSVIARTSLWAASSMWIGCPKERVAEVTTIPSKPPATAASAHRRHGPPIHANAHRALSSPAKIAPPYISNANPV
jgi:hypothetical protein